MPLALHRDRGVTLAGCRVAVALYGDSDGWEVSINSLARDCNISKRTASEGLSNLVACRWAAREALVRNRYVLHIARVQQFEVGEHLALNTYVPPTGKGGAKSSLLSGADSAQVGGAKSAPELNESLNQSLNQTLLTGVIAASADESPVGGQANNEPCTRAVEDAPEAFLPVDAVTEHVRFLQALYDAARKREVPPNGLLAEFKAAKAEEKFKLDGWLTQVRLFQPKLAMVSA